MSIEEKRQTVLIVKIRKPFAETAIPEARIYIRSEEFYDFIPLDWFPEGFFEGKNEAHFYAEIDPKGRLVLGEPAPTQDW